MNKRQQKKALKKFFASKKVQDSMRAFAKAVLKPSKLLEILNKPVGA